MAKHRLCIAAALLVLLAWTAAGVLAAEATARVRSWGDGQEGEVLVDGKVVMRIRSAAGGFSATQRAEQVAGRLNQAFAAGAGWRDVGIGEVNNEQAVMTKQGRLLITADRFHAQANGTTPTMLAHAWEGNLVQALGGQADAPAAAAAAPAEVNWERQADKIVPIFSIGTPGVSIGAARVVGPADGVGKVKAVAQIEAKFKDVLRAYIYIPVSAISTRPQRVQGVSVEALIDYNLPL
jgi:hypothetical protein